MISIWDVYLDAADAAVMLPAIEVLERHRAVREPLPIEDAGTLLPRLRRVARLADVPGDLVNEAQQRLLHEARRLLERRDEEQG